MQARAQLKRRQTETATVTSTARRSAHAALAEDARLKDDGAGFGRITLAYNVRERANAVLAEVEAAGATILNPAEDAFWGDYSGYLAGPNRHPWEVAWNPLWPLAEDDGVRLPAWRSTPNRNPRTGQGATFY